MVTAPTNPPKKQSCSIWGLPWGAVSWIPDLVSKYSDWEVVVPAAKAMEAASVPLALEVENLQEILGQAAAS